jgi:hypothetical protein
MLKLAYVLKSRAFIVRFYRQTNKRSARKLYLTKVCGLLKNTIGLDEIFYA